MSEGNLNQLFATDQEIYDLIMSSPKRMSESTLLELLADRGIFYPSDTSREVLASILSSLIHDHHDLAGLIQKGEHGRRNERTTFFDLDGEITPAEIKDAVQKYQESVHHSERIFVPTSTTSATRIKLDYDEIDYSRTRLIQRQRRQADFDIRIDNGKTRVRMPATDKARSVANSIKKFIEMERMAQLPTEEVSASDLNSAELRNMFFTRLITAIPDCKLLTVTDAKVARWAAKDAEEDELEEARRDIMHQIESVSMRGRNIVMTEQYQNFLKQGFFLTSMTWRADFLKEPHDVLQIETAFEDGHAGTGFRYSVRQSYKRESGKSTSFSVVSELRKPSLFRSIEEAARVLLDAIRAEHSLRNQA